jgi:hypothetical protein
MKNWRYWLLRQYVQNKKRQIPLSWGLPISITECSIDEDNRLRWRNRIWMPFYELLRIRIIQESHDSKLTGHPGRNLLKATINRQFISPGLSQNVK